MFERFTADARSVVVDARAHAARLGHPTIGTEHLLLAVIDSAGPAGEALRRTGLDRASIETELIEARSRHRGLGGADADADADRKALAVLGIDLDAVVRSVESAFGPGALDGAAPVLPRRRFRAPRRPGRCRAPVSPPFGPPAKRALEQSLREALRLRQREIGAAHVGLGILAARQGLGWQILARRGADLGRIRAALEAATRQSI